MQSRVLSDMHFEHFASYSRAPQQVFKNASLLPPDHFPATGPQWRLEGETLGPPALSCTD